MAPMKSGTVIKLHLPPNLGPRLLWQTRRQLRRIGAGAIGGAACLLLAALAQWHGGQLEQRQAGLSHQLSAAAKAAALPPAPVATEAAGVAAFHAYLPPHDTIPDLLKEMVKLAQQNGITLAKAEYKPQADTRAGFLRYQITLPVKADFANVQSFIINALQTLPTLTLESVAFKRDQIETGDIEARIQFALLVRHQEVHR